MSNTRIEREADKHIDRFKRDAEEFAKSIVTNGTREKLILLTGYEGGAHQEVLRAAPVVKALEAIQREMILPAHLEELLHKTLLTYKSDV